MFKKLSIMLLLAMSLAACTPAATDTKEKKAETTEAAKPEEKKEEKVEVAEVKEMKGEDLEKIQGDKKEKDKYLVVDVRSEEEYKAAHLPHAVNVSVDEIVANPAVLEDFKETPIILYCNTGKKSGKAAEALAKAGYKDVTNAQGVKEFQYTTVTYSNVLPKALQEAAEKGEATILDARDEKAFAAGHLKGAILVTPENVDTMYDKIPQDKPAYVYCHTGNRSGVVAQKLIDKGYKDVFNAIYGTKEYDYTLEK